MGQPAARLTDMHVCPMVTPGAPPIPHVGGPIMGPGVPTVLIGKMPAVVIGDMCTCVGPPDSIIKGSTTVLIGGRPAARMGDMTVHGGSIVMGCFTVLIGDAPGGGAVNLNVSPVSVTVPPVVLQAIPPISAEIVDQTTSMQNAADNGYPFCEVCGEGNSSSDNSPPEDANTPNPAPEPEPPETPEPKLLKCYFTDDEWNPIELVKVGDIVWFTIESINMVGKEVTIDLNDKGHNYKHNGNLLVDDILTVVLGSDVHKEELEVVEEPALKSIYTTDLDDVPTENIVVGTEFYLVVESVNMIGETIDIDLANSTMNYEYDGAVLEEDTLKGFTINNDEEKILLKAVSEDTILENDGKPKFKEFYFIDEANNKVTDVNIGQQIKLVIKSINMSGKMVSINLDGNGVNYEYNNNVLTNDLLEIQIEDDLQFVDLKVVAENATS